MKPGDVGKEPVGKSSILLVCLDWAGSSKGRFSDLLELEKRDERLGVRMGKEAE